MLGCWGGSSHVIQAIAQPLGVELPGLFAIGHCCPTLATLPSVRDREFWQLLLHKHGLAQVGFSFCFHQLHRLTDLALNHYGSRTPSGLTDYLTRLPRVARSSQPWALGRSPVGAGERSRRWENFSGESHEPATMAANNPKGIASSSPRLRGASYLG